MYCDVAASLEACCVAICNPQNRENPKPLVHRYDESGLSKVEPVFSKKTLDLKIFAYSYRSRQKLMVLKVEYVTFIKKLQFLFQMCDWVAMYLKKKAVP